MIKISCYKTRIDQLAKTFCQLAQKCYHASINTCVITCDNDSTVELDKVLWTYSRKEFIPHSTNLDPLPNLHPIYITDSLENPNDSKIIILINPTQERLLQFFTYPNKTNLGALDKIMIIFDDNQNIQYEEINNIIQKIQFNNFEINLFEQENSGAWKKT